MCWTLSIRSLAAAAAVVIMPMLWNEQDRWVFKKVIMIHDEGQWMTFGRKDMSLPSDNLL
jgi:hypothetical protein